MKAIPVPFCAPTGCPYCHEILKDNKTFKWCSITNKRQDYKIMNALLDNPFPDSCPLSDLKEEAS